MGSGKADPKEAFRGVLGKEAREAYEVRSPNTVPVATLIGSWILPPPKQISCKGLRLIRGLEVLLLGINDLTATPASSNYTKRSAWAQTPYPAAGDL